MGIVGRRGAGGNGGKSPESRTTKAGLLDPELAETLVQAMRSSGVDVAEARRIVREQAEAAARRAELEGPEVSPELRRDRAVAWARGEAARLEELARGYAPAPAAPPSSPRRRQPKKTQEVRDAARFRKARQRLEEYRAKLIAAGQSDADPVPIPRRVWDAARAASSPAGCRRAIAGLPKAIAAAVRRATVGEPGAEQYELEERRAVVVTAVVIWELGRRSTLAGCSKVTVGIPRKLIAAVVGIAVRGKAYSPERLFGTRHRGAGVPTDRRGPRGGIVGDFRRGECGHVVALEQSGALWRRQPPSDVVHARELGPPRRGRDGRVVQFAFTQYRFVRITTRPEEGTAIPTPASSGELAGAPPAVAQPP